MGMNASNFILEDSCSLYKGLVPETITKGGNRNPSGGGGMDKGNFVVVYTNDHPHMIDSFQTPTGLKKQEVSFLNLLYLDAFTFFGHVVRGAWKLNIVFAK